MNKSNSSSEKDYIEICINIAKDIELLKEQYPQLKEFELSKNLNKEGCKIDYTYKCHNSDHRGGWTSGVPNPDPEGVWFYIGLWDEKNPAENTAQINTQPYIPLCYIKKRLVTYLILEGEKTKSVEMKIFEIMKKHGLKGRAKQK